MGLAAIGYAALLLPQAGAWWTSWQQHGQLQSYVQTISDVGEDRLSVELDRARNYNARLARGSLPSIDVHHREYEELLSPAGASVMGELTISRLGIQLPIYHGTSDETLRIGVGHLFGTSLPVGGRGTHAVLTAHSGMVTSSGFNALHDVKVGDLITIRVLNQTLHYEVAGSSVVLPEEIDAIRIEPDQDLLTLITCTPIGINSHRLLVWAARTEAAPVLAETAASNETPGFPSWLLLWLAAVFSTHWLVKKLFERKGSHVAVLDNRAWRWAISRGFRAHRRRCVGRHRTIAHKHRANNRPRNRGSGGRNRCKYPTHSIAETG